MKNRFYNFKNETKTSNDLYLYGAIVSPEGKWDESDVDFQDFKDSLNDTNTNPSHDEFLAIYGSILGQGMILNWLLDNTDKNFNEYFNEKAQEELHQEFKI
jgi:hypothetical protein